MQAATLAALAMAGLVDVYEHRNKTNEVSSPLLRRKGCLVKLTPLCARDKSGGMRETCASMQCQHFSLAKGCVLPHLAAI